MAYENVYGTSPYDAGLVVEEYMIGDLVLFAGKLYTPDYVYVDEFDTRDPLLGIVVNKKTYGNYVPNSMMYTVYWFKKKRSTDVIGAHMRLAYARADGE
jgi:hypothetical protein